MPYFARYCTVQYYSTTNTAHDVSAHFFFFFNHIIVCLFLSALRRAHCYNTGLCLWPKTATGIFLRYYLTVL